MTYPARVTDRRMIEVEERIAFQEHTLEKLNRIVAEQQLELDALGKEVKALRGLLRTGSTDEPGETRALEDDRPPHY